MLNEDFVKIHSKFLKEKIDQVDIIYQIFWMLRNLICDSIYLRDTFLNCDLVENVIDIIDLGLKERKMSLIKSSSFLLFDCFKEEQFVENNHQLIDVLYKIIPVFINLNKLNDDEVSNCCLWSLRVISGIEDDRNPNGIQEMFLNNDGDFILTLLAMNYNENKSELYQTLKILGNLLAVNDDKFVDNMLEFDILKFFENIFDHETNKKIRTVTLWAISNIAGGHYSHVKKIVNSNLYDKIISMTSDYDFTTRKEAVYVLHNMCSEVNLSLGTELVKKSIFEVFVKVIEKNVDNSVIELALLSIEKLLHTGEAIREISDVNSMAKKFDEIGGSACLEKLQYHPNNEIYHRALNILEKYFEIKQVDNHQITDFRESSNNYVHYNYTNDNFRIDSESLQLQVSSNPNYNFYGPNGASDIQSEVSESLMDQSHSNYY